jgi:hypothetical protein
LVWTLLGLSLWLLIPAGDTVAIALTTTGAFGLGWALGYAAVIAPGGIGVREAAIVVVLSPVLRTEDAAAAALVSRGVWSACELTLGVLAFLLLREPSELP